MMHIRSIVLNFVKSLQLAESQISQESKQILSLVLEIFEYSDEERKSMFEPEKKKKKYGFL